MPRMTALDLTSPLDGAVQLYDAAIAAIQQAAALMRAGITPGQEASLVSVMDSLEALGSRTSALPVGREPGTPLQDLYDDTITQMAAAYIEQDVSILVASQALLQNLRAAQAALSGNAAAPAT